MHQSLESDTLSDLETFALRRRLRRALASDLNLPEDHQVVRATLVSFAFVETQRVSSAAPAPAATIDTWWCIVAHTHAMTTR
jgi:hypothetical protein